jgi:dTDP-4-amino-4,6-dideoxygalactose transaminase
MAERLLLIRNDGEAVVADRGITDLVNAFGFNLRWTEIPATIGIAPLSKRRHFLERWVENAEYLSTQVGALPGIAAPSVRTGCTHVYYVQPLLFDAAVVGVSRERFVDALCAELPIDEHRDWPMMSSGYVRPLSLQPMYQQPIAVGTSGCPFRCPHTRARSTPVTEEIEDRRMIATEFTRPRRRSRACWAWSGSSRRCTSIGASSRRALGERRG